MLGEARRAGLRPRFAGPNGYAIVDTLNPTCDKLYVVRKIAIIS